MPSPLTKTAFFNTPCEVSADSPPVLNRPPTPPPMSSAAPSISSVPFTLSVVAALRVRRPVAISAALNVLPSIKVPACRFMLPGLVHALALLIVAVPPLTTRLPALLKLVGVTSSVPALALTVPPTALVKLVVENDSEVPLALITPLLTSVAAFELLKPMAPLAFSVIPLPIE